MSLSLATQGSQSSTIPALLAAALVNEYLGKDEITLKFEDAETLKGDKTATAGLVLRGKPPVYGDLQIVEEISKAYPNTLLGTQQKHEKEWVDRAQTLASPDFKSIENLLLELDSHLTLRTYIVGYNLTVADIIVWGVLRGNRAAHAYIKKNHLTNLSRWFRYIEEANLWIPKAVEILSLQVREKKTAKSKEGASYDIALPDTEKGVVTRFPPEPSGYLHIGHAKAALLNDYFAHEKYKGTLILRFDDTNPTKEKEEFYDSILEDLALLGIKPDKISYSSDFFDDLYGFCVRMIEDGNAYADDTDQAIMRDERMKGIASKCRNRTVDENLAAFEEMKRGSEQGVKTCIRAKISVDNPNKAMRDPVVYRCNPTPHHRLGSKWNVYPTYDFTCPIVDSVEGVTHALRTNEYRDRNPQYEWMLEALKLRKVYIWDFARMNFIRTLLSKRKLTKFVEQGVVWGWDDPRFPTVRGIRRRGMTIEALREFILKQGPSRNIVNLDWTLIWATNKKYIDPTSPRYTAVLKENTVPATIKGGPTEPYTEDKPRHAKNVGLGTKRVAYSNTILIDQEDAKTFKENEEITLMAWGNAIVRKISTSDIVTGLELELHLQGDVKKTEKKITWLSQKGQTLVPVELVDFDYLITKDKIEEDDNVEDFLNPKTEFRSDALADGNVAGLQKGDIIQFERKGYFRLDRPYDKGIPAVFFNIPTGKTGK